MASNSIREPMLADIPAEQACLGALLIDSDAMIKLSTKLEAGDFFYERHQWIYEALLSLYRDRQPTDYVTVVARLQEQGRDMSTAGPAYLTGLINSCPTSLNVESYADIVADRSRRRRVVVAAGQAAKAAYSLECTDYHLQAETAMFEATGDHKQDYQVKIADGVKALDERITALQNGAETTAISTGFEALDRFFTYERGNFIVLAGRPGMGKTGIFLNSALRVAKKGKKVGICTLEMTTAELVRRLIAMESGIITAKQLKTGNIPDSLWANYTAVAEVIYGLPIIFDERPAVGVSYIKDRAMRWQHEFGLDLLIIDSMTVMSDDQQDRNATMQLTHISGGLKALARTLHIPVVASHQLSRALEQREDKRPQLTDLRQSGSVEQDADIVVFVHREDYFTGLHMKYVPMELITRKNRDGEDGTVLVAWEAAHTRIWDADKLDLGTLR